ncbi:hypothetical protein DBV15_01749 [Temnothorax longispinosus]|uniref:Uncharacterized protein n=1 Tax=Temnothorax longispinosus TaxID=300112 RepID=A0A4S2KM57_9HYME|nr:hypothetical protein DBV15_01749 [Temnothorax longispinosus]
MARCHEAGIEESIEGTERSPAKLFAGDSFYVLRTPKNRARRRRSRAILTNRSKDRRQLPWRLDYLATFHRYTASFTTASSPPPPPPPPSSEALWQRSSLGRRYRFPPIALSNFIMNCTKLRGFPQTFVTKLQIILMSLRTARYRGCTLALFLTFQETHSSLHFIVKKSEAISLNILELNEI